MAESGGKPKVGIERNMLGARPIIDIKADDTGKVTPLGKGMSVNNCPCRIPGAILPARLNDVGLKRGAIGDNALKVWSLGSGEFVGGLIAAKLELCPDTKFVPAYHGVLQPDTVMPIDEYQKSLAETKNDWLLNEQRNTTCPFCNSKS